MSKQKKRKKTNRQSNNQSSEMAPVKSDNRETGGLRKAWDGWIQYLLFAVVLSGVGLVAYYVVYLGSMDQAILGMVVCGVVFLLPLLNIIEYCLELESISAKKIVLVIVFTIAILAASAAPVLAPLCEKRIALKGDLTEVGDSLIINEDFDASEWELLLKTEMDQSKKTYDLDYSIRIHSGNQNKLIKDKFQRRWAKVRSGDKKGQEKLIDLDQALHRFEMDIQKGAKITLKKQEGVTIEPISVLLRPVAASWFYFFSVIVPLLLFSTFIDLGEKGKSKIPFYTSRASFILIFSFFYAGNAQPNEIFGALVVALFMGIIAAFALGWILPKLFTPVANLIFK